MYALPEEFVTEGLKIAKNSTLFGISFFDLSKKELIAAAVLGWNAYTDLLEDNIRTHAFMRELRELKGG